MAKTPHAQMTEQFKTKEDLVAAVEKLATDSLWLDRVSPVKGLRMISNAKLLRLHRVLTDAKQRFGSRDKLIGAILELEKRAKDAGYRTRLERHPLPRLLDQHDAAERRARRSDARAKAAAEPKPKVKRVKVAAKKPAAKKAAKKAPARKGAKKPAKRAKK